jgi:hypothetical protein
MSYTEIKTFKVIIAGGRDFKDYELLRKEMDYLLSARIKAGYKIIIISGTANGADKLGERYAIEKGYKIIRMPADWDKFGKSAGYKRNAEMADVADACAVFWDNRSKGTGHMINIAESKGLLLRIINY